MAVRAAALRVAVALLLPLVVTSASPFAHGPPTCDTSPTEQAAYANATVAALAAKGYTYRLGTFHFTRHAAVYGSNPSSLYGMYTAPPPAPHGVEPLFWQSEADVVLWLGCTPPPLKYFSFRTYVFDTRDPFVNVFASLGDSANNLVFNTTCASGAAACAFNHTAAVITAADAGSLRDVRGALASSGFPATAVNVDVIPSSVMRMGRDPLTTDSLIMLARVALFDNVTDGHYYTNSTWPVYFLTAPTVNGTEPLPIPPQRPRATGASEAYLADSLSALVAAVKAQVHGSLTCEAEVVKVPIYGFNCLANFTRCAGDNHDASYGGSLKCAAYLNQSRFAYVVGVNHAATGFATYSNFDVNIVTSLKVAGVDAVSSSHFPGSAAAFLPDDPHVGKLFAYKVARDCGSEPYCLSVPPGGDLAPDQAVFVATRGYLNPKTRTGPAWDELLHATVLTFTP